MRTGGKDWRWGRYVLGIMVLLVFPATADADSGTWIKGAAGWSGMAMGDINNADFRFYDYTINGFNFPNLDSGFSLSLHVGQDLSETLGVGFSWERQYARVNGTDQDVSAKLDLDANLFMGHLYWTPLRTSKWRFGAAAGLGPIFSDGRVKLEDRNQVNFGEGETSGTGLALEVMGLAEMAIGDRTQLQLTIGWRDAVIDEFKYQKATAVKDDGSLMTLDYTGYIVKLGVRYQLGWGATQGGDIN